jgi:signal transduction protein with GAF and PtsI domain
MPNRNSGNQDSKQILEALAKISEAVTSDRYLEDILKLIVTVTAEVMGSKICSLMLLNDKKELVVKATQSVSDNYNKKPNIKLGEGIAGLVASKGEPITSDDVRKDERYINRDIAKKEGIYSLLSVPLKVKGRIIGVLNSYTSKPHKFSKDEIIMLNSVANQAAIVIENFRLVVETKVVKEELEARKIIEKAKGILMKRRQLSEDEAYSLMRKYSMDNRKTIKEVANAIILNDEMNNIS